MHRRKALTTLVLLSLLVLTFWTSSAWATTIPNWWSNTEISNAVSLRDGSHVYLRLEEIIKIKNDPAYIVVVEPFSGKDRLICLTTPSPELRLGQVVDVEGDLTTLPSGVRALRNVTVWGYASESGELTYHPSIIKCMPEIASWPWNKIDLTDRSNPTANTASTASVSSDEPNTTPAEGPRFYPRIRNATDSASPRTQRTQGVSTQSYYPGIPNLTGLAAGSLVELQCKRIIAVGTQTINGTPYKYLDMAEDSPSTDWIRCYYSAGTPTTSNRINKITGQIRYTSDPQPEVICVDDGPGYNPQTLVGELNLVSPNTVAFVRTQANGATTSLTGKVIVADNADFPGAFYIQESTRIAGIRVIYTDANHTRGDVMDVTGTISTASDGERQITATSVSYGSPVTAHGPFGMPNRRLGGGDFNAYTPGISCPTGSGTDLFNKGQLVKTWGTVTFVDSSSNHFYIDDGSALEDGSGHSGVKVGLDWTTPGKATIIPPEVGWYVSVTGISSSTSTMARLLRVRNQNDVVLHAPNDTGDPTVSITSPYGTAWHKASNANHIVVSGTADDAETGVISVEFKADGGTWNKAVYDPATKKWTYDWQIGLTPPTGTIRIYARATDFARNTSDETYKDITVTNTGLAVIRVDTNSTAQTPDGSSWQLAFKTITDGLNAAASGQEVWVASGKYTETSTILLESGVALFGGFTGVETAREQRDWRSHETILDGSQIESELNEFSVVMAPDGADSTTEIDGFTVRNGKGRYDDYTYVLTGGGIYCANSSPTISNNRIAGNSAAAGGGVYCRESSPIISNNTITGNVAYEGGGAAIYCYSGSATIINNTITGNSTATCDAHTPTGNGGGIYCGVYSNPCTPSIINNTIVGNSALDGGGMFCATSTSPSVVNNILAFNTSGIYRGYNGTPTISYNCVYGNKYYDYKDPGQQGWEPPTENHNISADPQLASKEYGNFHIQPGTPSPCKDTGDDNAIQLTWLDMDGQTRKQGTHVDIGADESDGTTWQPGPYIRVRVDGVNGNDGNDGSDWQYAMATVQSALDIAALKGGEVWVKGASDPGITYSECVTMLPCSYLYGGFDGTEQTEADKLGRNIIANITTLYGTGTSGNPRSTVTVMGGSSWNAIEGFAITHGTGNILENWSAPHGGGICCLGSSTKIWRNKVTSNAAGDINTHAGEDGFAGAIYCGGVSFPEIRWNLIKDNSSAWEGGALGGRDSTPFVANNRFENNATYDHGAALTLETPGGGLALASPDTSSDTKIANNLFINNSITGPYMGGSGISMWMRNWLPNKTWMSYNQKVCKLRS